MIVSHRYGFVFMHNPKVGGTSVRATIERFHDDETGFWGSDPAARPAPVDRAHLGLDEVAAHYPGTWARMQDYAVFCLVRDPWGRFFSSLAEHSKLHGATDTRFAGPAARRTALMALRDRLEGLGRAEAVMDRYELRHFRPQWIYWHAETAPAPSVRALPVERIDALFAAIAARTGTPLVPETRNSADQLDLPGPLSRLAGTARLRDLVKRLPGKGLLKTALRARYHAAAGTPAERFGLTEDEEADLRAFVMRFYARDLALWPA